MFQRQSALAKYKLTKKKEKKKKKKKRPNQVRKRGFYSYSKHFPQCVQSDRILHTKAPEERREVGQFLQRIHMLQVGRD